MKKMSIFNKPKEHDYLTKLPLLLCALLSLSIWLYTNWGRTLLWDLGPIIHAINDYSSGLNPYRFQEQSMFVYHPLVLRALYAIDQFVVLRTAFEVLYPIIAAWFFAESVRFLSQKQSKFDSYVVIAMAMVFGGVTLNALLCGNFSAYFHLVLIGLIFNYLNRQRILVLYLLGVALVCFALVKPYFLAYTVIYFLVLPIKKAFVTSFLCGVALCALWFSGAVLLADQYADFLQALQYQLVAKDDLGGFSTLRILGPLMGYQWAFLFHVTVVGALSLLTLVRIYQRKFLQDDIKSQALIFILLIVLLNPRVVFYDFFAVIFVLFYLLLTSRQKYVRILLWGFPIALYSQLAAHSIRWVILAYAVVCLGTIYGLISGKGQIKSELI
jgi:hypothetical protein